MVDIAAIAKNHRVEVWGDKLVQDYLQTNNEPKNIFADSTFNL